MTSRSSWRASSSLRRAERLFRSDAEALLNRRVELQALPSRESRCLDWVVLHR